ncbi:dienelactone hydrolase [Asticcacaulis sp. AC460]|uniref:dienelactone hydrolase family protein n=1 Tax=Asticcacaulis sp. AC460 TaxID=1282360 RepID=UPI0003C3F379|nr:dienelactone hydrolase family protein [Asticcacaulis sp. AC460]ESQ93534.1 dienelactone hydrolase [Asticcacaulis sp. AC460]
MLDTVERRFARLEPHITAYGPDTDVKLPAVLLFHACNGVREHIHGYARQAEAAGYRAFVIDSFTPRGWDESAAMSLVCSGLALHGYERSGDVLAAVWGIQQRADVDGDQIILAGWSHGGWAIMDLMTQKLTRDGEARLQDPNPAPLAGVKGVFLVYPYANFPARSNIHHWYYTPKTKVVLPRQDFLTAHSHSETVFRHLAEEGLPVDILTLNATHCFDEDSPLHFGPFMTYDRASHQATGAALDAFLAETLK